VGVRGFPDFRKVLVGLRPQHQEALAFDGKIVEYQINMMVRFVLDD
jgi:hypothetical protein